MSLIKTEQLVLELCKETGEPAAINNQTIWTGIFDGIRDLAIFGMPLYDSVEGLSLNNYNAICWPDKCIKPLIVYLKRDGKAIALDVDNSILHTNDEPKVNSIYDANRQVQDFFRIDGFSAAYTMYHFDLGELYGYGGGYGHVGVVKNDKNKRQSQITGIDLRTDDSFGMFFKTDGLSKPPIYIPAEIKTCLELFVLQKYFRVRNPGLGATFMNRYKEEFGRVMKFYDDDGIGGWLSATNSNDVSSPKG
jgi:hypothetical protein